MIEPQSCTYLQVRISIRNCLNLGERNEREEWAPGMGMKRFCGIFKAARASMAVRSGT